MGEINKVNSHDNAKKAGYEFDITEPGNILQINSPKNRLLGPYVVVHTDLNDRWAIVAMHWNNEPRLGIRWFWDKLGNPLSRMYPTWFVIPDALTTSILSGLPLSHEQLHLLHQFLIGGDEETQKKAVDELVNGFKKPSQANEAAEDKQNGNAFDDEEESSDG